MNYDYISDHAKEKLRNTKSQNHELVGVGFWRLVIFLACLSSKAHLDCCLMQHHESCADSAEFCQVPRAEHESICG